jgi:hypothetical protein
MTYVSHARRVVLDNRVILEDSEILNLVHMEAMVAVQVMIFRGKFVKPTPTTKKVK